MSDGRDPGGPWVGAQLRCLGWAVAARTPHVLGHRRTALHRHVTSRFARLATVRHLSGLQSESLLQDSGAHRSQAKQDTFK
jgi:hypothetical protein